jgi:hypothetical protein
MKKIAGPILVLSLLTFSLSGCLPILYNDDDIVAGKKIDAFLTALDSKDAATVKATFSKNTVASLPDFDQSVTELLAYYQGEHIRNLELTVGSESRIEYGKRRDNMLITVDFLTSKVPYRTAYEWCWRDDFDSGNIGISTFSIVRYYDDIHREYAYWGGTDRTPGIHVGAVSPALEESSL